MTPEAIWSPQAEADLEDIIFYIAVEDGRPLIAEQFARQLRSECER